MSSLITIKESKGVINRIGNGCAWVHLLDNCTSSGSSCQGGGCGACGGKKSGRTIQVTLDNENPDSVGNLVSVRYTEINELAGALVVFGIPLACALLSLLIWYLAAPGKAESGMSILSAGAAFAAGFLPVRIIDGFFRRAYPSRIIHPGSAEPALS